ncbi:uncharacterized protein LOC136038399 [Artemia franciscana]|uniref:uncharacterized protein LOC136038399 n=1 Tax=Artemia franciscana TaxID=6661 RepID=UPI0032DA79F7
MWPYVLGTSQGIRVQSNLACGEISCIGMAQCFEVETQKSSENEEDMNVTLYHLQKIAQEFVSEPLGKAKRKTHTAISTNKCLVDRGKKLLKELETLMNHSSYCQLPIESWDLNFVAGSFPILRKDLIIEKKPETMVDICGEEESKNSGTLTDSGGTSSVTPRKYVNLRQLFILAFLKYFTIFL